MTVHTSSLRKTLKPSEYVQPIRAIDRKSGLSRHATSEEFGDFDISTIPKVERGEVVMFYYEGNVSQPSPAYVLNVEAKTLTLGVLGPTGVKQHNTVHWMNDPRVASPRMRRYGGWDVIKTGLHARVEQLESTVLALLEEIESLKAAKK